MLLALSLPLLILTGGWFAAVKGRRRNRRLTFGFSVILAVISLAAVLGHNPALVR